MEAVEHLALLVTFSASVTFWHTIQRLQEDGRRSTQIILGLRARIDDLQYGDDEDLQTTPEEPR